MILNIEHNDEQGLAILSPNEKSAEWIEIRKLLIAHDDEAKVTATGGLTMQWPRVITALVELSKLQRHYRLNFKLFGKAEEIIKSAQADRKLIQEAQTTHPILREVSEIDEILKSRGFTKRELRPFQKESVQRLLSLKNGADFSVPGAGKTTVAIAIHTLVATENMRLLVVAPKNAFSAWDEVIEDCFENSYLMHSRKFTRLTGTTQDLRQSLELETNFNFIISYDKLVRELPLIRSVLQLNPFHVILDESHRIKGGDQRQRGKAVLALSTFPVRKDILTGTPAPNSPSDLSPQLEFLWPGQGLGNEDFSQSNVSSKLRNFFVRTTKSKLGLKPAKRHYIQVEMADAQKLYYALLRDRAIREELKVSPKNIADLTRASQCVVRLLQAVTNPIIAVGQTFPFRVPEDDPCRDLYEAVIDEGDSPKLRKAAALAFEFAQKNEKVVIWACFHANIDRLTSILQDLGPVSIDGRVGTGDENDDETREGRIKRFHDDPECRVLIANPSAGSEGISLHKVCHKAIYLERTYNAAHYLQSLDRIHRLGLPPEINTDVYILQSIGSQRTGSIDYSVSRRLRKKMENMEKILNDPDILQIALDEENSESLIEDIELADIDDVLHQLTFQDILEDNEQS
ncbi:SNF2-related protein [Leptospira sp. SA-E8]|uniref:SNF2-related protein n=1 Tax=Leptospira sp. SA-E8 TaxID=3422259 RepID=UPI003EBEF077